MSFDSILIANRGEIALRINRAAKGLGLKVIQAYSKADADSLPVRLADEAVEIGPPQASKSYLSIPNILEAAKAKGAGAVHPGYGFLAENAAFASAVEEAGMVFVGPRPETIATMGDKVRAREAAMKAGVPCVPGSDGRVEGLEAAQAAATAIGYPLLIKASAGGGGRGIRIVRDEAELAQQLATAQGEAKAAFGDGGVYLEAFIERARHVEVQVLGDGSRAIHAFERECSLQRRRQKVWEEAPSPSLDDATRQELCMSAVRLAEHVGYRGAGTLEYLYDEQRQAFYFIEMNTRIQVEHPVTEMVTGLDLVAMMIEIARGKPLSIQQSDVHLQGHAIECRINAEDPARNFMPGPGVISGLAVPAGEGVRFDSHLFEGYMVPPFYDSLLGKLIVHGPDREQAMARLEDALAALDVQGVPTTRALHQALVRDSDVRAGRFDTNFLERWLETGAATLGHSMNGGR
ncbi:MAG TPA: acetyl-CoA carboxylase biotin carboxylase subunit [Geminicoccus sp.]|jgi:acetyl-CoA carboxylase biotin carboxylase subunit|uniref:acetyl-CoA carboxylase biotin carboxylase subunit n=1 Tax=Geminicoccus sp. TaxID=2024832 RepID=UPI002E35EE64|nr:acetyl-CoA carboxylase biotin carboxylase subunit [Geminicoccus sp.]HEX2528213.1 acetyl-CoA carboxylase biotin carboxylase subunit [Geminicoccus sp.]